MKEYGVFDILGPVMIGPSSSHTAGAARLGKIARAIAGEKFVKVEFYLHGSFAKTYKGHGTDRALVAGILGFNPWDERLPNSLEIAKEKNLEIVFKEEDMGDMHPNTVKFVITTYDGNIITLRGSSIGGGNIVINELEGQKVEFTGNYPTLIINQQDKPGVISNVTAFMQERNINIAFMKVSRISKGSIATTIFETDSIIPEDLVEKLRDLPWIISVRAVNPILE